MTPAARGRTRGRHAARRLTRRAAIASGGAGLAMLGLAAYLPGTRGVWRPDLALAAEGEPLRTLPVRLATNGLLETTLEARSETQAFVGSMTYESELPGPVLRLQAGNRLKVKLVNNLGGAAT